MARRISPSPFIPPRPLSNSNPTTPAVQGAPVIPQYVPPQEQQRRSRQPTGGVPIYPSGVPSTPMAPVGSGGLAADWIGYANDWEEATPMVNVHPPRPRNAAPQVAPQAMGWGGASVYNTPWTVNAGFTPGFPPYQTLPPGTVPVPAVPNAALWPPGPGAYPTPYPPAMQIGPGWGYPTPAVPGWGPPLQPPAPGWGPPPPPGGAAPPMERRASHPAPGGRFARAVEKMDVFDKWAESSSYGPVLSPLEVKKLGVRVELNPLIQSPRVVAPDHPHLTWNMLFHTGGCHRSDDPPGHSWSDRNVPATWPRISMLRLVSPDIPWMIPVNASNSKFGVTCDDVLQGIYAFLHQRASQKDYAAASPQYQKEISHAYYENRSTNPGVPGGRLGGSLHRYDFLLTLTMFGGIVVNEGYVKDRCQIEPPCTFELVCEERVEEVEEERRHRSRSRQRSRATSRASSQPSIPQ